MSIPDAAGHEPLRSLIYSAAERAVRHVLSPAGRW